MTLPRVKSYWTVRVNARVCRPIARDSEASRVSAMFGLRDGADETLYDDFPLTLRAGQVVAVVGPSGAGKSVLLDAVARRVRGAVRLRAELDVSQKASAVSVLKGGSLAERLGVLSRCGLAEATALITPAGCLSGGQRYRLALARALHTAGRRARTAAGGAAAGAVLVIADEFAAMLDAATAETLCRQVRKLVTGSRIALLLATPRAELMEALQPDQVVVKPIGRSAWLAPAPARGAVGPAGWPVERGRLADYKPLSRFHYLAGPPALHKRVYVIRTPDGTVAAGGPRSAGVLIVSPPLMHVRGRNVATCGRYTGPDRRAAAALLNAEVEAISRVIVHPVYRGCGLAVRLIRHALLDARTPLVEALAAMGAVHPLFEKAGMKFGGRFQGKLEYSYYIRTRHPGRPHRRR